MSLFDSASLVVTPNGYKAGKLYSIKPTSGAGDLDVVRATSATRVNASGLIESVGNNIPRLDYTNASCPSILVEPQRTNLFLRSEEFNNASWLKSEATILTNVSTSPDGSLNADKFIPTANNQTHQVRQIGFASNAYTFSVYAKAGEETIFSLWLRSASVRAIFDLSNGTIISTSSSVIATMTSVGNGWYRCSVYDPTPGTTAQIYGRNGSQFAGNGTDGFFLWGAQLEVGSNATSYIPTVASTVTRNADVISKTGIGSVFGTNKGTIFCDFIAPSISNVSQYVFDLSDNVNNVTNRFAFYKIAAGTYQLFTNTATNVTVNTNTRNKVAITWNGSTVKIYANGALKSTITYANANPTKINLGSRFNNVEIGDVNYNLVTAFATDLTEQQCIDLTTL